MEEYCVWPGDGYNEGFCESNTVMGSEKDLFPPKIKPITGDPVHYHLAVYEGEWGDWLLPESHGSVLVHCIPSH